MVRVLSIAILVLTPLACNARTPLAVDEQPDPPKPSSHPGEKWEAYAVNSYRCMELNSYDPLDKRTEIWQEYRMTLESKTRVRLTLPCGQWRLPDASEGCGQGVLVPNEKVWTRHGLSATNSYGVQQ
jgi:hypothetical protein